MVETFYSATFVLLCTNALCKATIQATFANFTQGRAVVTSYMVSQPLSKIQYAVKCFDDGKQGGCNVAGYNTTTKGCFLSIDIQENVVDVEDVTTGDTSKLNYFFGEKSVFV